MKDLIILGAGGTAAQIAELVESLNEQNKEWNVVGYLDDNPALFDKEMVGYKVIGTIDDAHKYPEAYFISSIAHPNNRMIRREIYMRVKQQGGKFATLISPDARVSKSAIIKEGTLVFGNALIGSLVTLEEDVCLFSVHIGHESVIKAHTTASGSACIAGGVVIGSDCYISTNTSIAHDITIGDNTLLAIGSAATNNLKGGDMYIGVPAIPSRKYGKLRLFINSLMKNNKI